MNILIIDIDSRIPNLALKKVELYHLKRGDTVVWNMEILERWADKIYVSCVFTKNRDSALSWKDIAEIGGSGYDLETKLPPEIEAVKPHINLGFTIRGCIRNCPFCIVPEKEGGIRIVGDLLDLWDGKSREITVLDNNILAVPDHFLRICRQAREHSLLVDFNQGLDHRLLTEEIVAELKTIRHREYRFAFDDPAYLRSVEKAINLLQAGGLRRSFWYVLVGFNTTFAQDLERLEYLKARGQTAFVQRYEKTKGNRLVGQWANQHNVFKAMTFWEFLEVPRYKRFRVKYKDEIEPYLENCERLL